jgi:hypothetical protein
MAMATISQWTYGDYSPCLARPQATVIFIFLPPNLTQPTSRSLLSPCACCGSSICAKLSKVKELSP